MINWENKIVMCSIFKYKNIIGRNFDYQISYNEELRVIKKGEHYNDSTIIGMCTGLVTDEPLMYDGMNAHGLMCGALAFEGNAYYYPHDEDKFSPSAYEFVNYILRNFHNVEQVKDFIGHDDFQIDDVPYSDEFPNSDLHWFIADKDESIIVEQTKFGLNYYTGEVMTNNPVYPLMRTQYNLIKRNIGTDKLDYNTRGVESWNLSGGYTSVERFERLSWLKNQLEQVDDKFNIISEGFHLLSSVEQLYGATPVNKEYEYTIYSIIYDLEEKSVYLKFYDELTYHKEKMIL